MRAMAEYWFSLATHYRKYVPTNLSVMSISDVEKIVAILRSLNESVQNISIADFATHLNYLMNVN